MKKKLRHPSTALLAPVLNWKEEWNRVLENTAVPYPAYIRSSNPNSELLKSFLVLTSSVAWDKALDWKVEPL